MPKPLYVSELEHPAPIQLNNQKPLSWFNRFGGYLVETRWNPQRNQFDTIYHPYDYPDTKLMPTE
jgi:hypothetical protein